MIEMIKKFFKQIFCHHEYQEMIKSDLFCCISGERIYVVCKKCGKIKSSYFLEHD